MTAPGKAADISGAVPAAWPGLVIFDCDGVLVDSELIALACTRSAFRDLGIELSATEVSDLFLGMSAQSMPAIAQRALGAPLPEGFQARLASETLAAFERELRGVDGIDDALSGLGAQVCVASSSSPERLQASLRIVGYFRLFSPHIFSAAEVRRGKPEPDLFLHAARAMGAAPEACLVIEDSAPGVTAARRAGMIVFGFVGGAHAKGDAYRQRLQAAGANLIFDDMRELPAHVAATRAAREMTDGA